MTAFKDHFSQQAASYAHYRPAYPEALFTYLAHLAPAREHAWDCATGNGQAALGLAGHFERVMATDASAEQIKQAIPHPRITYAVAPADRAPVPDASMDLVTVAQALHWLPFETFYAEVRRVARPGGILAAWSYGLLYVTSSIDPVLAHYYDEVIGPYWPPERHHVETGYQSIPFPFDELEAPTFHLDVRWRLPELVGYLRTWSATQRFIEQEGQDPLEEIAEPLAAAWGEPAAARPIRWPINLRVGRID